ncbi:phosphatase PAP2 family protein [Planktomarina sp.]|jgi:lipid A 1-phosphatase|nr:phosphatase PAP2 family protein [Planktomarina sp.]MDA9099703.1 phosphatase PAP2 family protein [Planktomarina sp.]MDA9185876.1 phosphatase PAP2 family protein [Planktomarina sp.]
MTFVEILRQPITVFHTYTVPIVLLVTIILISSLYPSDLENDYSTSRGGEDISFVVSTEKYGRHINTLLPFALAIISRDKAGFKQILVIAVSGIIASHGPKRILNNVKIMGTRLGQRPFSSTSKHNTPSGHSTLAGATAYFVMRRYSWWFAVIVIPVLLCTMYARVMLDKHTISATLAGAATGLLVAALFSTKFLGFRIRVGHKFRSWIK